MRNPASLDSSGPPNAIVAERERLILKRVQEIDEANSELLKLEMIASRICKEIKSLLKYDFVAVQMIDLRQQLIQTIHGSGLDGEWYNIASHSLEGEPKFLDIQAHLVTSEPPVIEIIEGWDDRFDKFIFEKYGHIHYVRAFVPLIVARDSAGRLMQADPQQFCFETTSSDTRLGAKKSIRLKSTLPMSPRPIRAVEIIGTIEAGFDNSKHVPKQGISIDQARELFRRSCVYAKELCQATLYNVLEVITESAREIAGAYVSSLHFPFGVKPVQGRYDVWAGPPRSLALYPPRKGGLGEQAITLRKPMYVPNQDGNIPLSSFNPAVHRAGIRAMAAFPLIVDKGRQNAGVLYVGAKDEHIFSEDEIHGLTLFTNLAKAAIRHATHYAEAISSARRLSNLHEIAKSLASEDDTQDLLNSIGGHTLNILSADLVIIFEYDDRERHFIPLPAIAGRCDTVISDLGGPASEYTPPVRLIERKKIHYAHFPEEVSALFRTEGHAQVFHEFVKNEQLIAGAAAPLFLETEMVGVMFILYRRTRVFAKNEKRIIETLASTAAVAIWNRRLLKTRESNIHSAAHQLRTPLLAITQAANDLREGLTESAGRVEREDLFQRADQIAAQLEILDALCEGVFVTLTRESGDHAGKATNDDSRAFTTQKLDMKQEIERIWDFVQFTKDQLDLQIQFSDHSLRQPLIININRRVFTNVIYSLLDNAFKYADKPSAVKVDWIQSSTAEILLRIGSIGQPIESDERAKVFWKFRKGRVVRQAGVGHSGAGIGLWVARGHLQSIGGDICLELDPMNPRLSTFTVKIPSPRTEQT